jgi:hypothetical protein
VDSLTEATLRSGYCRQRELAERLIQVSEALPDRAEAHDGLVSAAISFTFAGQYDRAREVARQATNTVARLGAHHEIHAASAEALALLPAGRFAELADVTARTPQIVRDEGYHCWKAAVALAGFALTMFETGERSAADEALELLEPLLPGKPRWRAIDIIRPLAGVERTQRVVASLGHPPGAAIDHLHTMRLELQLTPLTGEWDALRRLTGEAKALAREACAPALGWIAEWAAAAALAADDGAGAVRRAERALGSLEKYGEPYTAARLFVDLLPFLEGERREALAEDTIKRLEAMGAHGSAAEAGAMLAA